jgi:hypothetical protein
LPWFYARRGDFATAVERQFSNSKFGPSVRLQALTEGVEAP